MPMLTIVETSVTFHPALAKNLMDEVQTVTNAPVLHDHYLYFDKTHSNKITYSAQRLFQHFTTHSMSVIHSVRSTSLTTSLGILCLFSQLPFVFFFLLFLILFHNLAPLFVRLLSKAS